jgi:predicted dehydrogenase
VDASDIERDIPIYEDMETLLEREAIDALWMTLPNSETPRGLTLAADHGVDVYAEKTLARTADELAPVIEKVEDAGILVVTGYQNRAKAIPREIRDQIQTDLFGDLRSIEARMIASQISRYRDPSEYVHDAEKSRGGILQWLGCHTVDLINFMLDETIDRVNAQVDFGTRGVDVEDGATVQFELAESGALGTLQAGYYVRDYDTYMGIHGSDGRAVWSGSDTPANKDVLEMESYSDNWPVAPRRTIEFDYDDAPGYGGTVGLNYMRNFLEQVNNSNPDPELNATIFDSFRVLQFLDAAYESAQSDEWVTLEKESGGSGLVDT